MAGAEPSDERTNASAQEVACPRCGSDRAFDANTQALRCAHCGHETRVDAVGPSAESDLLAELRAQAANRRAAAAVLPPEFETKCASCGAIVRFEASLTATTCGHCGGALLREHALRSRDRLPVDALLPFAVDADTAREAARAWARKLRFAPNAFRQRVRSERPIGVYLPYFTFDATARVRYAGQRGDTHGVGDQERVRWRGVSGELEARFEDLCIAALRSLPERLLRRLEPWPTEQLAAFDARLLAGHQAHRYELPLDEAFRRGQRRMDDAVRAEVRERIGGDQQRIHELDARWRGLRFRHVLLPLWILPHRHRRSVYRVLVNARTGEVSGERPYSLARIALTIVAIAGASAAIALLLTSGALPPELFVRP
jgi:DNA-directed RNA polymerase subunit RPC12/RpoP